MQKGALFEKYFEAEKLSVDESEELLKIFADYVNANKPDKYKKDSPKDGSILFPVDGLPEW